MVAMKQSSNKTYTFFCYKGAYFKIVVTNMDFFSILNMVAVIPISKKIFFKKTKLAYI